MSTHERLKTVLERLKADCQLLHDVLHKEANAQVVTETGPLKTLAGIIKDLEQRGTVPREKLHQAIDKVEQLQRDVIRLCHEAIMVRDRILRDPPLVTTRGIAQTLIEGETRIELFLQPAMEVACYRALMRTCY